MKVRSPNGGEFSKETKGGVTQRENEERRDLRGWQPGGGNVGGEQRTPNWRVRRSNVTLLGKV